MLDFPTNECTIKMTANQQTMPQEVWKVLYVSNRFDGTLVEWRVNTRAGVPNTEAERLASH